MNNWKIEGKSKRNIWKVLLVIKILFFFFFFTTRKLLEVPFKASAFNFIPISLKLIKLANEDFDESENERLLSSQLKIYIYTLIIIRKTRKDINFYKFSNRCISAERISRKLIQIFIIFHTKLRNYSYKDAIE